MIWQGACFIFVCMGWSMGSYGAASTPDSHVKYNPLQASLFATKQFFSTVRCCWHTQGTYEICLCRWVMRLICAAVEGAGDGLDPRVWGMATACFSPFCCICENLGPFSHASSLCQLFSYTIPGNGKTMLVFTFCLGLARKRLNERWLSSVRSYSVECKKVRCLRRFHCPLIYSHSSLGQSGAMSVLLRGIQLDTSHVGFTRRPLKQGYCLPPCVVYRFSGFPSYVAATG